MWVGVADSRESSGCSFSAVRFSIVLLLSSRHNLWSTTDVYTRPGGGRVCRSFSLSPQQTLRLLRLSNYLLLIRDKSWGQNTQPRTLTCSLCALPFFSFNPQKVFLENLLALKEENLSSGCAHLGVEEERSRGGPSGFHDVISAKTKSQQRNSEIPGLTSPPSGVIWIQQWLRATCLNCRVIFLP